MKKIILLIMLSINTFAGGFNLKMVEGVVKTLEIYDIYDTYDFINQQKFLYTDIYFGYKEEIREEFVIFYTKLKNGKYKRNVRTIKKKLLVPTIVLKRVYPQKGYEDVRYWVDLTRNKVFWDPSLNRAFSTLGWLPLSQKDANKFFTAEVMEALKSAYSI